MLVFACKGKTDVVTQPKIDSAIVHDPPPDLRVNLLGKGVDYTFKNFTVSVLPHYELPEVLNHDSSYYFEDWYLIVRDNNSKVADTMAMELEGHFTPGFLIEDMSDSLRFKSLLLQLKWTGSSDIPSSHFIEFGGGSLRSLFGFDYLHEIRRIDENTLAGFVTSRDEVVSSLQHDYPFTISTSDYAPVYKLPEIQYIGYPSETFEAIEAYKLNDRQDTIPVPIPKGTKITVDTLYRNTKTVRLLINDSIPASINIEKLSHMNIRTNTAG